MGASDPANLAATPGFAVTTPQYDDQRWRLANLYMIRNARGRGVPFQMNRAQQCLYERLHTANLILKARQLGMTTFVQLYMLDVCLFCPDTAAGTVAHTLSDAEAIFAEKVRFSCERLPWGLRTAQPTTADSARTIVFENGSRMRVGTSLRSGTYQLLHVSEHGKICARYPAKAAEIRAGALNTVQPGQMVFVESTADGREGDFHDFCQAARRRAAEGRSETALDFRFHFFAWWRHPDYVIEPAGVTVAPRDEAYFERLTSEGIALSDAQKAWYVKKREQQGEAMMREFPSTPDEAFAASVEGAYFAQELARLRADGRLCAVPHEPALPVNTFWDLGIDDTTAIWFHQRVGRENRFIDYYEASGEGLAHYAKILHERPYVYASHYLPHDAEVRELGSGLSRRRMLEDLGARPIVTVPRPNDLGTAIQATRNVLASCWFDVRRCAAGVRRLDDYRKEWDDRRGVWRERPRHDASSHAADAFRCFAMGYREPRPAISQTTAGMDWDPLALR